MCQCKKDGRERERRLVWWKIVLIIIAAVVVIYFMINMSKNAAVATLIASNVDDGVALGPDFDRFNEVGEYSYLCANLIGWWCLNAGIGCPDCIWSN